MKKPFTIRADSTVQREFQRFSDVVQRKTGLICYDMGRILNFFSGAGIIGMFLIGLHLSIITPEKISQKLIAAVFVLLTGGVCIAHEIYLRKLKKSYSYGIQPAPEPIYINNSPYIRLAWTFIGSFMILQSLLLDAVVIFAADERMTILMRLFSVVVITLICSLPLIFGSVFYLMKCRPKIIFPI